MFTDEVADRTFSVLSSLRCSFFIDEKLAVRWFLRVFPIPSPGAVEYCSSAQNLFH